jgi:hypothetical protein
MPLTQNHKIEIPMRTRVAFKICFLIGLGLTRCFAATAQSSPHGPEVRAFLDLMRQEEVELDFMIKHNEITRREFLRSREKINIMRQTVLDTVKQTGEDIVPEIYVKAAPEVGQLIEDGLRALKGIKRGDVIKQKWRYLGTVTKGEVFYIFERLTH